MNLYQNGSQEDKNILIDISVIHFSHGSPRCIDCCTSPYGQSPFPSSSNCPVKTVSLELTTFEDNCERSWRNSCAILWTGNQCRLPIIHCCSFGYLRSTRDLVTVDPLFHSGISPLLCSTQLCGIISWAFNPGHWWWRYHFNGYRHCYGHCSSSTTAQV